MWKDDNDKIEELFINIKNIKKLPTICPICESRNAHIYMHFYDEKTRRGGLWVWCSECNSFSHSSIYVPEYWKNCPLIEVEKLCGMPTYLNEMKEIIDAHVERLMNNCLSGVL